MTVLYVALAIALLLVLPAYLAGRVAERKGRMFVLFFSSGMMLGPIVLVAALLLPRRRGTGKTDAIS